MLASLCGRRARRRVVLWRTGSSCHELWHAKHSKEENSIRTCLRHAPRRRSTNATSSSLARCRLTCLCSYDNEKGCELQYNLLIFEPTAGLNGPNLCCLCYLCSPCSLCWVSLDGDGWDRRVLVNEFRSRSVRGHRTWYLNRFLYAATNTSQRAQVSLAAHG